MKAIVVTAHGDPDVLQLAEFADLQIAAPYDVLIQVKAAGVNNADLAARRGTHHKQLAPPFTPGLEVVGHVLGIGAGVEHLRVGQRVVAFPHTGGYAEQCLASAALTFAVPDDIPDVAAASFPIVLGTSIGILEQRAQMVSGESVLIHGGAGAVGTTAIQVARSLGAGLVLASSREPDTRADLLKETGADAVIGSNLPYAKEVLEKTGGAGVDIILNCVGGTTIEEDLRCLAPFGRLVVYGHVSGESGTIGSKQLGSSHRSVSGYTFSAIRAQRPQLVAPIVERSIEMVARGDVHFVAGGAWPLVEASDAHRALETRAISGKAVLTMPGI